VYSFSRAIYRDLKRLLLPVPARPAAERRLLGSCEAALERLVTDPRYFSHPAESLFEEVRCLFPVRDQLMVFELIDVRIAQAMAFISDTERGGARNLLLCRATTRKGKACRRLPLSGSRYCPSHKHLERQADTAPAVA
jgi:hypothetical protein